MNHYYSQCQPRRKKNKVLKVLIIAFCIYELIALYGWMQQRDAQPDRLSVITYECSNAPTMEMDMPIQQGMQL